MPLLFAAVGGVDDARSIGASRSAAESWPKGRADQSYVASCIARAKTHLFRHRRESPTCESPGSSSSISRQPRLVLARSLVSSGLRSGLDRRRSRLRDINISYELPELRTGGTRHVRCQRFAFLDEHVNRLVPLISNSSAKKKAVSDALLELQDRRTFPDRPSRWTSTE